jgi:glycosyltransferase involved in cell wall biosynthesis
MNNLTLIIPAKKEKESLSKVLDELKPYNLKIIVILEKEDIETIDTIRNKDCEILYQKNKGYGDALIQGINYSNNELFCIFNADGSFNPIEIKNMVEILKKNNSDLVFASRYEKNCSSEDDTFITSIGNFIFTKIGNIFFKLNITDILYTFVIGKTEKVRNLNLKSKDFVFCVELPIKAKRNNLKLTTSKSNERARIGGQKKPNAFKDGLRILFGMIKFFFKN